MGSQPLLLTETEAAEALRLSARTLRKARTDGRLRYILIGRAVRYTMEDLESFIESLRQGQVQCAKTTSRSAARRRNRASAEIVPFRRRRG